MAADPALRRSLERSGRRMIALVTATEAAGRTCLITWYKEGVAIRRAQEYVAAPSADAPEMVAALAAALPTHDPETPAPPPRAASKVSYKCPKCFVRVWGKPDLSLICGKCYQSGDVIYLEVIAEYLQQAGIWVSARPRPS